MDKKTLVIGASENTDRYSNKAVKKLLENKISVVALGKNEGFIENVKILTGTPALDNIHTISIYLNPQLQQTVTDYLLSLNPKRIIFNPGTENPTLSQQAQQKGIEVVEGCTLVMLATKQF